MGNAFCHIELSTANVDAAKKFYKSIFDWKLSDMPMGPGMTYTMIGVGKGVGGGMQTHPMPGAPTSWVAYVEVADVKKVIDKARAGGAQIVVEYMPVGDMGSIGIFVDPQGATLGVWAPTKKPAAKKAAKPAKKAKKKKGKK